MRYCASALSILLSLPPQVYSLLMGYRTVAQITFEAWEKGKSYNTPGWRTSSETHRTMASVLKALKKYHHTFLMGEPSLLFYRGSQKWMNEKKQAAIQDWQTSARIARGLGMPWDEANALREIGKRSQGEIRKANLKKALALFQASHATYDALETGKMLGE